MFKRGAHVVHAGLMKNKKQRGHVSAALGVPGSTESILNVGVTEVASITNRIMMDKLHLGYSGKMCKAFVMWWNANSADPSFFHRCRSARYVQHVTIQPS